MKKSLVAAMFAVMMISLVGCSKASEPKTIETPKVVEESETETEAVVEETTEVTEVVEATETEAPAEEPVAEESSSPYSYTELNQTMYAQSTVNVRDLPEQTGAKLGSLSTNQKVTVLGQCNETGWYRISYNGGEGFVSNSYLGSEKVAVKSSKSSSQSSSGTTASAPAQEAAAEAPAESADDNHFSADASVEDVMAAVDAGQIHSDYYYCICGFETTSYDEYVAHVNAEEAQQ